MAIFNKECCPGRIAKEKGNSLATIPKGFSLKVCYNEMEVEQQVGQLLGKNKIGG